MYMLITLSFFCFGATEGHPELCNYDALLRIFTKYNINYYPSYVNVTICPTLTADFLHLSQRNWSVSRFSFPHTHADTQMNLPIIVHHSGLLTDSVKCTRISFLARTVTVIRLSISCGCTTVMSIRHLSHSWKANFVQSARSFNDSCFLNDYRLHYRIEKYV